MLEPSWKTAGPTEIIDAPDCLPDCATQGGRWYACDCDGILFERGDGAPNRCHACGMFAKRHWDCTCLEIEQRREPCPYCGRRGDACVCP